MTRPRSLLRTVATTLATTLGGFVLVAASATAGAAADQPGSIAHVETTDAGLQILVSVPADTDVDLSGVQVTVDGKAADATASPAAETTDVRRTAVLAIDTSNSMRGERFDAAKQAALQFVAAVPADVEVGIVAFAGDVTESLAPTTDRAAARTTIGGLELSSKTRLYDGVLAAVAMAGDEGQRTLLVLSDGADTTKTALTDVTSAITDAGVIVDVVALEQSDDSAVTALGQLATAGGGRVIPADSAALAETFSQEADILARQVLVTAQVPVSVTATEATVAVSLPTADGSVTAEAFTAVRASGAPAAPTPTSEEDGWATPQWVMYAGVAALGVGLVVLLLALVPSGPRSMSAEEKVAKYTAIDRGATPGPRVDTDQALSTAKDAAANVLRRNKTLEARISRRLEGAGSELRSSEWLLLHAAIFVVAGLLGLLVGRGSLVFGLIFLAVGGFGPWLYLGFRRSRRRKAFNSQLPDTLQLMSGSLSAGLSLAQSIDTVVREGNDPIGPEFRRVLVETRIGVSLEDAMEGVAERFDSKDFAWVVMAIKIQRQVGGNLAELLDTVAATMREREYMRRQVAALAAEGKLSAYVLGGLPPLFMIYLLLTNYDYVIVMFTEPLGLAMLGLAGVILSVGVFWMSKLIKVEV